MRRVTIVTDGVATVPEEVAREYGILIAPFHVNMDDKDYLETEIDRDELYTRLRSRENLPTTSPPSPGEFLELCKQAGKETPAVLIIVITSGFSQAYNSALNAKSLAAKQLPDTAVEVFDSLTVVGGQMLVTIGAAKAAQEGKSLTEVIEAADSIRQRVTSLALRESLFHFDRSGRVGKAKDWAKSELPTATVLETSAASGGMTKPILRERTLTKAIDATLDLVDERSSGKPLHVAITHTNAPDKAEMLRKKLVSRFNPVELYLNECSLVAAAINGEGLVEFGCYAEG
jgi:DegV family protein with EDD domain